MRINPINNYTYCNKTVNHNKPVYNYQNTNADCYVSTPTFMGLFDFGKTSKISKFLKKDVPYNYPETRAKFKEFYEVFKSEDLAKETKLILKAKSLIEKSQTPNNNALFATELLLLGLNNGSLASIENKEGLLALLKTVVDKKGDEILFDINSPDELDLCLQANPELDVNKHYINEDSDKTLISESLKTKQFDKAKYLVNRDDFDFYNVKTWELIFDDFDNTFEFLKMLPKYKFQINDLQFPEGHNLLTKVCRKFGAISDFGTRLGIYLLQNFPDLDTNVCPNGQSHLLIKYHPGGIHDVNYEFFKEVYKHPKTDKSVFLNSGLNIFYSMQEFIESVADSDFEKKFRTLYEENGIFLLDEMKKIVDYKNFKKFANTRLNFLGDRFGHMLSDIKVDESNPAEMEKLEKIFSKLKESGYAFNATNDLNQSPLDRAIEAENKPVIDMLRHFMS